MENEEILEIVRYLFSHTSNWDDQRLDIYNHKDKRRSGLTYKDELTIKQMVGLGIFSSAIPADKNILMKSSLGVTSLISYPCFSVTYKKMNLFLYLVNHIDLEFGKMSIKKDGEIWIDGKKKNKTFKPDIQRTQFIGMLALCKNVSYEEFGSMYEVSVDENSSLGDKKMAYKEATKKIKRDAVKELMRYGLTETYINKHLKSNRAYGYFLTT